MAALTPTWTQYVYNGSAWSAVSAPAIYTINDATIQGTSSNYKSYPIRIPATSGNSNYSAETYVGIVWTDPNSTGNVPSNVKVWESSGTLKDTNTIIWAGVVAYGGTGAVPTSTRYPTVPASGTTGTQPFSSDSTLVTPYDKFIYSGSSTNYGSTAPISLAVNGSAAPFYSDMLTFLLEVPSSVQTTGDIASGPVVITVQYDEA